MISISKANSTVASTSSHKGVKRFLDLTVSAPKSFSVACLLGDDKTKDILRKIHLNAVNRIIKTMFKSGDFTYKFKKGIYEYEQPVDIEGVLDIKRYLHYTSRNGDPQLHTHVVINLDLYQDEMGQEYKINNYKLYFNLVNYTKLYHKLLFESLKEVGFKEVIINNRGYLEIKTIPKKVSEHFSSRRQEVLESIEESNGGRRYASVQTRGRKVSSKQTGFEATINNWKRQAAEVLGYSPLEINKVFTWERLKGK